MGYFASISLSADPRWRQDSVYVFGVDGNGNTLFSGDPYRWGGWTLGGTDSELTSLEDRDDLSVADAFGETFLYYMARNPATGMQQRKVVFVKRSRHLRPADPDRLRLLPSRMRNRVPGP